MRMHTDGTASFLRAGRWNGSKAMWTLLSVLFREGREGCCKFSANSPTSLDQRACQHVVESYFDLSALSQGWIEGEGRVGMWSKRGYP